MIKQKINYIHANPVKAGLVKTARDYPWSSFRSYYGLGDEPLKVDREWCWPEDSEKLSKAMKGLGWYSYWKRREDK
jgi:REP-associated tyrosine transposase